MCPRVHFHSDRSSRSLCGVVSSSSGDTVRGLDPCSARGAEAGGRRAGFSSLASVASGHSLVAPCGLGNSEEAGGGSPGGGAGTPSHSHTGCGRAGRRTCLWCGRASGYRDVRGGCQWSSTCVHVNRTEGGVHPSSPGLHPPNCVCVCVCHQCDRRIWSRCVLHLLYLSPAQSQPTVTQGTDLSVVYVITHIYIYTVCFFLLCLSDSKDQYQKIVIYVVP